MMTDDHQELEVKLYLADMQAFQGRVEAQGAKLVEARLHEVNLRFDTPDESLTRSLQVLRLRQDTAARLTYKGPGATIDGVYARREIEFTVSNYKSAQALLEVLGYRVSLMYEKYRTTYDLDGTHVTLDEMPYGNFTEIEGPDPDRIRFAAQKLDIDWEARIVESYTTLFDRLRDELGFTFRDLSFENFAGMDVPPAALGVRSADE